MIIFNMNDIFWKSSIGSATGDIYIPKGIGPFPTIIIFVYGVNKKYLELMPPSMQRK